MNETAKFFNPNFLPAPTVLLSEGWELAKTGIITDSLISSTIRIALGFVIGSAVAVGLGVIMSKFKTVERWFSPILSLVGPIPTLGAPAFVHYLVRHRRVSEGAAHCLDDVYPGAGVHAGRLQVGAFDADPFSA